jgi:hypothetical protein
MKESLSKIPLPRRLVMAGAIAAGVGVGSASLPEKAEAVVDANPASIEKVLEQPCPPYLPPEFPNADAHNLIVFGCLLNEYQDAMAAWRAATFLPAPYLQRIHTDYFVSIGVPSVPAFPVFVQQPQVIVVQQTRPHFNPPFHPRHDGGGPHRRGGGHNRR